MTCMKWTESSGFCLCTWSVLPMKIKVPTVILETKDKMKTFFHDADLDWCLLVIYEASSVGWTHYFRVNSQFLMLYIKYQNFLRPNYDPHGSISNLESFYKFMIFFTQQRKKSESILFSIFFENHTQILT